MFAALTERSLSEIRVVREFVGHHEKLLDGRDAAARQEMKLYSVSSTVTRLYAIYEAFVETLVADFVDVIPELSPFEELSEGMRSEYRMGISHLLNRLDSPRYRHIDHSNLIRWYHEALTSQRPYRFISEALTRHDENLRLSVLSTLLRRVELNNLQGWVANHSSVLSLFPESTAIWEQVEAEIKNFIQLRNDAAHGALSNLVGSETLARFCDLVSVLIEVLSTYAYRELVLWRHRANKLRYLGSVTEVFGIAGAFIVPLQRGESISQQGLVHFVGPWSCTKAIVVSIQLDGSDTEGVGASNEPVEVGLKTSVMPARGVGVYAESVFLDQTPIEV